jgi:hypothetical protein
MNTTFGSKLTAALKNIFGVVVKGRTYANILYLMLAFPLGLLYFVFLAVGISLGIGLYILIIGLPLLILTMLAWRQFVKLERFKSRRLLGARIEPEAILHWSSGQNAWRWFRSRLSSPVTWKGLGYLFLKFPLGLLAFILLIVLGVVSLVLTAMPFIYQHVNVDVGEHIDLSMPQALIFMVMGLFLALFSLHIWNGLAFVFKRLSERLLTVSPKTVIME